MATLTERLQYIVNVNADQATKAFNDVGKAADKGLGTAESRLDKVGGNLTKFGAGAMAASGIAGAALFKAASSFQDLAIEAGKFSDATGIAVDDASRWIEAAGDMGIGSKDLETSLGFMNKALGRTPELFAQYGVEVVKAKDGTTDVNGTFLALVDRLNAIQDPAEKAKVGAELLGRSWQNIAELISTGSDGLKESLDSVSDAKVINPEELQKAKDMRASMDTLHDALDDITLAIGQGAAPMLGSLASGLGRGIDAIAKLNAVSGGAVGSIAGIGTVALGSAGAVAFIAGQVIKFRTSLANMSTNAKYAAGVVGALSVAMGVYAVIQQQAARDTQQQAKYLSDLARVADKDLVPSFRDFAVVAKGVAGTKPEETFARLAQTSIGTATRLRDNVAASAELRAEYEDLGLTVDEMTSALDAETEAQKQVTADSKATTDAVGDLSDSLDDSADAAERGKEAAERYATQQQALNDQAEEAADALRDQADAILETVTAMRDAADASFAVADATSDYDDYLDDFKKNVKEAGKDQDALNKLYRDGAKHVADIADATVRQADEQAKANGQTYTATQRLDDWNRTALDQANRAMPAARSAIYDYIGQVNQIPAEKMTEIQAAVAAGDLETANRLLNEASAARTATIKVDADTAQAEAEIARVARDRDIRMRLALAGVQGFASGTKSAPGGVALVGEQGPELVELPPGSQVHTASETRAMASTPAAQGAGGGGGLTVIVQGNVYGDSHLKELLAREVIPALRTAERRNGPGWRGGY